VRLIKKGLSLAIGLVAMAALLVTGCAGHVRGMKDVRWLTDAEKEKMVEIALATPQATERLAQYGPAYKADLSWVTIVWEDDGQYSEWRNYEYDIVATGLPRGEQVITVPGSSEQMRMMGVPESAEIYSWVVINFGEPPEWQVYVAVNPDTGRVALFEENPYRMEPIPSEKPD
jgi:hypothetical protein